MAIEQSLKLILLGSRIYIFWPYVHMYNVLSIEDFQQQ
jgi:hypothetical protein